MVNFDKMWEIFGQNITIISYGILSTLILALFGTIVGLILGIFLAYGKNIKLDRFNDNKIAYFFKALLKGICNIYSSVIRGTPMMVQALLFKYGSQALGVNWGAIQFSGEISYVLNGWLFAGLIVITLNTSAYMGEIVRSGLNGIDKGQVEGARSLGFSASKTSLLIVLPQALKNAIPTIGNELIVNIKDSSVLNVITVTELYYRIFLIAGRTYSFMECYLILAIIYLALTLIFTGILKLIEKKLNGKKISLNPFGRYFRKGDLI